MALLGQLLNNAFSDTPQDYSSLIGNSIQSRLNLPVSSNNPNQDYLVNPNQAPTAATAQYQPVAYQAPAPVMQNVPGMGGATGTGLTMNTPVAPLMQPAPMQNAPMQNAPMQNAPMQNAPMPGVAPAAMTPAAAPAAPVNPNPIVWSDIPGQEVNNGYPQGPAGMQPTAAPAQAPANLPAPAEAAPTSTAANLPGIQQQPYIDMLMAGQSDPSMLAKLQNDKNAPDFIRKAANDHLLGHLNDYKGQQEALDRANEMVANNDTKGIAKEMSRTDDEGSYIKAYLLHRFGLTDLAKQEQIKLGAGSSLMPTTLPDGTKAIVRMRGDGVASSGYTEDGRPLDNKQLQSISGTYIAGAQTGQTFGKDSQGNVWSHTILPNGRGIIWKNESTGETSSHAPAGYSPVGQVDYREKMADQSAASTMNKMRAENTKAVAQGAPAPYTEEQIQTAGNQARVSAYHGTPLGGPGAGVPITAPTTGIGSDLSDSLRNKIVSAQRSNQALWDESVQAGRPGRTATGLPIAQPGTSQHEVGNAIDLPRDLTRAERQELAQKGYYQPLGTDSVHWEKITPTGTTSATVTTAPTAAKSPIRQQAEAIYNGDVKMPTGMGANNYRSRAIQDEIQKIAAERGKPFDPTVYDQRLDTEKKFNTGKQGDTVRSMNVAVDHLDTLTDAARALNNNDMPLFNKIANEYSRNTGSPLVTNFDGIKSIVGSEVAKAVSGAGGSALGDREEIRKEIDAANSPQQLEGVIKKYQQLMAGQIKGLESQYKAGHGRDFDSKVTPRTRRVLNEAQQTRSNW